MAARSIGRPAARCRIAGSSFSRPRAKRRTGIAYVQARHFLPNDTGDSTQTMFGYYTNRFIRTRTGWKIHGCKLTLWWQTGNPHIFTLANERVKAAEAKK
jgi:hypothetical protein